MPLLNEFESLGNNANLNDLVHNLLTKFGMKLNNGYDKKIDLNNLAGDPELRLNSINSIYFKDKIDEIYQKAFVSLSKDLGIDISNVGYFNSLLIRKTQLANIAEAAEKNPHIFTKSLEVLDRVLVRNGVSTANVPYVSVRKDIEDVFRHKNFERMGMAKGQLPSEVSYAYEGKNFGLDVGSLTSALNTLGVNPNGHIRHDNKEKTISIDVAYIERLGAKIDSDKEIKLRQNEARLTSLTPKGVVTAEQGAIAAKYATVEDIAAGFELVKSDKPTEGFSLFGGKMADVNEAIKTIKEILNKPNLPAVWGVSMVLQESDKSGVINSSYDRKAKGFQAPTAFNLKITDEALKGVNDALAAAKGR